MAVKCGIVGLPNVGKSTLFNCISTGKAQAANFPFCTIEPNIGSTIVPDKRLQVLENLVENDPDALIMAMSDHGARYAPGTDPEDAITIFNTFYYAGEDLQEYTGKSSVNTIRSLLNLVLSTDFEEIPVGK